MSDRAVILAADVGGTTTSVGLVDDRGEVLTQRMAPTRGNGLTVERIASLLEEVKREGDRQGLEVEGIGIGIPGAIARARGRIGPDIHNLPELANTPLRSLLQERFSLPVFLDNDVNALALGEGYFGVARGIDNFALLAVGTGVGSGVVVNGRLVRGASGYGGEFGHIPLNLDGRACFCGSQGCLKAYVSGPDIAAQARERLQRRPSGLLWERAGGNPERVDAEMVFQAAKAGDPLAAGLVEEVCRYLGAGLAAIINGLNPELLILTGGVAESLRDHFPEISRWCHRYAFAGAISAAKLVCLSQDKRTSVRGAAALVLYELGK